MFKFKKIGKRLLSGTLAACLTVTTLFSNVITASAATNVEPKSKLAMTYGAKVGGTGNYEVYMLWTMNTTDSSVLRLLCLEPGRTAAQTGVNVPAGQTPYVQKTTSYKMNTTQKQQFIGLIYYYTDLNGANKNSGPYMIAAQTLAWEIAAGYRDNNFTLSSSGTGIRSSSGCTSNASAWKIYQDVESKIQSYIKPVFFGSTRLDTNTPTYTLKYNTTYKDYRITVSVNTNGCDSQVEAAIRAQGFNVSKSGSSWTIYTSTKNTTVKTVSWQKPAPFTHKYKEYSVPNTTYQTLCWGEGADPIKGSFKLTTEDTLSISLSKKVSKAGSSGSTAFSSLTDAEQTFLANNALFALYDYNTKSYVRLSKTTSGEYTYIASNGAWANVKNTSNSAYDGYRMKIFKQTYQNVEPGQIKIINLPVDHTFAVCELENPYLNWKFSLDPKFTHNNTNLLRFSKGGTTSASIVNNERYADFYMYKFIESGTSDARFNGVPFRLYYVSADPNNTGKTITYNGKTYSPGDQIGVTYITANTNSGSWGDRTKLVSSWARSHDADGYLQITNLPLGKYKLVETTPYHVIKEDAIPFTIDMSLFADVNTKHGTPVTVPDAYTDDGVTAKYLNKVQNLKLNIRKENDNGTLITSSNATFRIIADETANVNNVRLVTKDEIVATITTKSGIATAANNDKLITGVRYRIEEVKAPDGYEKVTNIDPVYVDYDGSLNVEYKEKTVSVKNKVKAGIELHKVDAVTDDDISGAKFTLYEYDINDTSYSTVLNSVEKTTTSSGKITFTTIGADNHFLNSNLYRYQIAETKEPADYVNKGTYIMNGTSKKFDNTTSAGIKKWNVSFKTNTTATVENYYKISVIEVKESKGVSLSMTKTAKNTEMSNNNFNGTKYAVYFSTTELTESNFTLNNATWDADAKHYIRTINTSGDVTNIATFTINSKNVGVPTITADGAALGFNKTGNALTDGKAGWFAIIETECTAGNGFDNTIHIEHIVAGTGNAYSVNSEEPAIPGTLKLNVNKIAKIDDNVTLHNEFNEAINDSEFTLNFYKGLSNYSEITSSTTPTKTIVYTVKGASGSTPGKIDFSDDAYIKSGTLYENSEWPTGLFVIKETKASKNFDINVDNWHTSSGENVVDSTAQAILARTIVDNNGDVVTQYSVNGSWVTYNDSFLISGENPMKHGGFSFTKEVSNNDNISAGKNITFDLYYFSPTAWSKLTKTERSNLINNKLNDYKLTEFVNTHNYDIPYVVKTNNSGTYTSSATEYPVGHYILRECKNTGANVGLSGNGIRYFEITANNINDITANNSITNYVPTVSTTEWDAQLSESDYKSHMSYNGNNVIINDLVNYKNFVSNRSYKIHAILMDITDGNIKILMDANKNIIQASGNVNENFNIETISEDPLNGSIDISFDPFDSSVMYTIDESGNETKITNMSGHKFVVFEYVFDIASNDNLTYDEICKLLAYDSTHTSLPEYALVINNELLGHYDMSDINQIGYFPEIHTTESDFNVPGHISPMWEENGREYIEIKDELSYSNLDSTRNYEVYISIRNAETDEEIYHTSEILYKSDYTGDGKKMSAPYADGTSSGKMTTDKITVDVTGVKSFYICEELYLEDTYILVASHTDKIDSQTGYVARIGTKVSSNRTAYDLTDSIIDVYAAKNLTLTDTITYENLGSYNYRIVCEYHYVGGEHNGEIVKDANGKTLTKTITSNNLTNGSIDVTITGLDCSKLKDETIVSYETFYYTDSNGTEHVIAKEHKDDSITQSLRFVGIVVNFNKVNQYGEFIKDTGLEIRKTTEDGELIDAWTTDGEMHSVELDDGTYYLVETKAPKGYALNKSVKFTVDDCKLYLNGKEVESLSITLTDPVLTALPDAGGIGTIPFVCAGMILMLVSAAFVLKKKDQES